MRLIILVLWKKAELGFLGFLGFLGGGGYSLFTEAVQNHGKSSTIL